MTNYITQWNKFTDFAIEHRLSPNSRSVYMVLFHVNNSKQWIRIINISHSSLLAKSGLSGSSALTRAINELVKYGLINILKPKNKRCPQGYQLVDLSIHHLEENLTIYDTIITKDGEKKFKAEEFEEDPQNCGIRMNEDRESSHLKKTDYNVNKNLGKKKLSVENAGVNQKSVTANIKGNTKAGVHGGTDVDIRTGANTGLQMSTHLSTKLDVKNDDNYLNCNRKTGSKIGQNRSKYKQEEFNKAYKEVVENTDINKVLKSKPIVENTIDNKVSTEYHEDDKNEYDTSNVDSKMESKIRIYPAGAKWDF